jgi:toxin CcdB
MARFDVYATPGRHADSTPYLLDVQSDLLDGLDSRVVIPLRRRERFPAVPLADRLTPTLSIAGAEFILETPKMGAVPRRALGAPLLSLAAEQERVTAAMDFVFRGF